MAYYTRRKRHYYAAYSPYGVECVYNDCNPGTILVFDSRDARDSYVNDHNAPDPYHRHYEPVTAREARRIAPATAYYHQMPDGCLLDTNGYMWTDDGPVWEG